MPIPTFEDPPELPAHEVHLWWGFVGGDEEDSDWSARISAEEETRALRFHRARHGRRFRGRRAFLRAVLARYEGRDPLELVFEPGAHGKPALASSLTFNLSHTDDVVLLAVSRGRALGADVQVHRLGTPLERVARQVLTVRELAELEAAPVASRSAAFFRGWTRKEAALKATGEGLTRDPRTLELGLAPRAPGVPWRTDEPALAAYSLCDLVVPRIADEPLSACLCAAGEGWSSRVIGAVAQL